MKMNPLQKSILIFSSFLGITLPSSGQDMEISMDKMPAMHGMQSMHNLHAVYGLYPNRRLWSVYEAPRLGLGAICMGLCIGLVSRQ